MIYYKREIIDEFTPLAIYKKLEEFYPNEKLQLLESAITNNDGNFSYILVGSIEELYSIDGKSYHVGEDGRKELNETLFSYLKRRYKGIDFGSYKNISSDLGVDFIDGFAGFIGYDVVKEFEPTLKSKMDGLIDEIKTPDIHLIRPKIIVAYSHKNSTLTLITPKESVYKEFDRVLREINSSYKHTPIIKCKPIDEGGYIIGKERFMALVDEAKEMIRSGDIFQILLSNRFKQKIEIDPFSFYRILKSKNPSPYMYLLDCGEYKIVGSSPEVMVRLQDEDILLKPIAGTRKRGKTLGEDIVLEEELLSDTKERAEHLMLVDLGRNDVGRVAKAGSVKVNDLMHVELYSHVMHIVTDVVGKLDPKFDMFDLFASVFTAGTMTGAPKIRAMELIAEFEGIKRGFYSGSIGYFGFNGNVNTAITIRTALIKDKEVILQAGAGIVADSIPEMEYKEVENKLRALHSSIDDLCE